MENKIMNGFDYFDSIYCINLPEDVERKKEISIQFDKLNILNKIKWKYAQRPSNNWSANNYNFNGEFGVNMSQLKALIDGATNNPKNGVIIFEDDVWFLDNTNEILTACVKQLPTDWDVLYLGGTPKEKMIKFSTNIMKVNKFISAMAYAVSAKAIAELCMYYTDRLAVPFPDACCDKILNDFIVEKNHNAYACFPAIAWDVPGWSTLRQGPRNYSGLIKQAWKEHTPNEI
jgi:GR25 family glycosyltransferase involved in LPS biosynthesis